MATSIATPGRGRFTLNVRTWMLVVLLIGGPLDWVAYKVKRAEIQRRAISQIESAGGLAIYDYNHFPPNTPQATRKAAKPRGPEWLRRWIGAEYFQEVVGVSFQGRLTLRTMAAIGSLDRLEVIQNLDASVIEGGLDNLIGLKRLKTVLLVGRGATDTVLEKLGTCSNLEMVWVQSPEISDAGVAHLAGLTSLKNLILVDTPKVTDATIENVLPTLPSLTCLALEGSAITDNGMNTLGRLTRLESLQLSSTKLTDQGLDRIQGLTRLQVLFLAHTQISDAGLVDLKEMTDLVQLNLSGTKITGQGFEPLVSLEKLSFLMLRDTQFSDAGMPFLAKLNGLQYLVLDQSQVSDAGLAQLRGKPNLVAVRTRSSKVTAEGMELFKLVNPHVRASN